MAKGTVGSYYGTAKAGEDLIPIFKENELKVHPNSFLRISNLIVKKIAIAAQAGTKFKLNETEFLMPSESFELSYGTMDIKKLVFLEDSLVTIAYVY